MEYHTHPTFWIPSASTLVLTLRQQGFYPLRYLFLLHQTQGFIKNVCRDWGDNSGTKSTFWANMKALTQIPSTPDPAPRWAQRQEDRRSLLVSSITEKWGYSGFSERPCFKKEWQRKDTWHPPLALHTCTWACTPTFTWACTHTPCTRTHSYQTVLRAWLLDAGVQLPCGATLLYKIFPATTASGIKIKKRKTLK